MELVLSKIGKTMVEKRKDRKVFGDYLRFLRNTNATATTIMIMIAAMMA